MFHLWFWPGAIAAAATIGSWALRETVISRAIAGLCSAAAGWAAAAGLVLRLLPGPPGIGAFVVSVAAGALGALFSLALAIKLTEGKDGSRALVTAGASAVLLFLL